MLPSLFGTQRHMSWVCGFVRMRACMSRAIAMISGCSLLLTPSGALRYHAGMPEIARFLGIVIGIPQGTPTGHFHAVYG